MGLAENCGAELVLEQLRAAGVDRVFGIPGSTETPFLERMRANGGPSYVLGLHEGVVVSMADGYARARRSPSVVMLHTTAGSLNGMAQIYNARRNSSPVVVLAGHKDRTVLSEDGFCAIADLASIVRNVTKWSSQSLSAGELGGDVTRALHFATTPPMGPTYLAMPVDLLEEEIPAGAVVPALWPRRDRIARASGLCEEDLRQALAMIAEAERPLLVLGSRVAHATSEVSAFADEFGLPIVSTDAADLTTYPYPPASDRYLGSYGEQRHWLPSCDLVIAVGCRTFFPYSMSIRSRLPENARLLHIDSEEIELGWDAHEDFAMLGDPAAILRVITERARLDGGIAQDVLARRLARRRESAEHRQHRRDASAAVVMDDAAQRGDGGLLSVERLALELQRVLPAEVVVFDEALRSSRAFLQLFWWGEGASVERNRGGALGWGVPAAIGWALAQPGRPVLALVGDGSFQFSVQALWSAVQQGVSLVVLVLDNGGYLAVKRHIEEMIGIEEVLGGKPDPRSHPGVEISGLDHVSVARGYGARATSATTADEVGAAVTEGFRAGGVHVIVARVAATWP